MIPLNVHVIDSDNGSVTIRWEVSIITYPPVNYYVEYGINTKELIGYNENITMIDDGVYSLELTCLDSSATYYYHVVANNSVKYTASNLGSFIPKKCELFVNIL